MQVYYVPLSQPARCNASWHRHQFLSMDKCVGHIASPQWICHASVSFSSCTLSPPKKVSLLEQPEQTLDKQWISLSRYVRHFTPKIVHFYHVQYYKLTIKLSIKCLRLFRHCLHYGQDGRTYWRQCEVWQATRNHMCRRQERFPELGRREIFVVL